MTFLTTALAVKSQDRKRDYIVTVTEDTIYGKLKTNILGRSKLVTENDEITCDAEKIQAYYKASRDKMFRALLLPDQEKNQWAEVLEDGIIILYEAKVKKKIFREGRWEEVTNSYLYASKVGVGLVEIKTDNIWGSRKKRKEGMRALIEDDAAILKAFEEMEEYTFESLREVIVKYNERAAKRVQAGNVSAK